MKAAQIQDYGGISAITINESAIKPLPAADQVLVKVVAASLNPYDYKLRSGLYKDYFQLPFPFTLSGDFAGVIEQVGESVTNLKMGDEVYGQAGGPGYGSGSLAEFAAANASKVSLKPRSIDFIQAAALPLAGISELQGIEQHIQLKNGQKILIHGGAGGIGSIAIQIAKALGAYVATTVSPDDKEFVTHLGADEVIDYKNEKFEEKLKDYDAVFDTAGGDTTTRSFTVLKPGGILVSMVGQPDEALAKEHQVTAIGQNTESTPELLKRLAQLVDTDKVKVQVDKVFQLSQTQAAFRFLEENSPKGKVVVRIEN